MIPKSCQAFLSCMLCEGRLLVSFLPAKPFLPILLRFFCMLFYDPGFFFGFRRNFSDDGLALPGDGCAPWYHRSSLSHPLPFSLSVFSPFPTA